MLASIMALLFLLSAAGIFLWGIVNALWKLIVRTTEESLVCMTLFASGLFVQMAFTSTPASVPALAALGFLVLPSIIIVGIAIAFTDIWAQSRAKRLNPQQI